MKPAGWEQELKYKNDIVVGIDEVGRGAWAGPLVSVSYRFFDVPSPIEVGDSKTIRESKRIELVEQLQALGEWGIGEVSAKEIDSLGLSEAQLLSYQRAIDGLSCVPDIILLDGRPVDWVPEFVIARSETTRQSHVRNPEIVSGSMPGISVESIIDGDALIASIAAASIIAKVHRDTYMKSIAHKLYPDYGFDSHVGYGTKQHQMALAKIGITPLHRGSFRPIREYI